MKYSMLVLALSLTLPAVGLAAPIDEEMPFWECRDPASGRMVESPAPCDATEAQKEAIIRKNKHKLQQIKEERERIQQENDNILKENARIKRANEEKRLSGGAAQENMKSHAEAQSKDKNVKKNEEIATLERKYQMLKKIGIDTDYCPVIREIMELYLQENDENNYIKWRNTEETDCEDVKRPDELIFQEKSRKLKRSQ